MRLDTTTTGTTEPLTWKFHCLVVVSSAIALWPPVTPAIRIELPPGPVDNKTVLGLDATVDALDSQVCALLSELLLVEWKEAEDEDDRCV